MITAAACSLNDYFISDRAQSNNVTLYTLNTTIFQHKNFKILNFSNFGYQPKAAYYMYGTANGDDNPTPSTLIYLGNTTTRDPGTPPTGGQWSGYQYQKWGNPFWHNYISGDSTVWVSTVQPTQIYNGSSTTPIGSKITKMSNPMFLECRYNPWLDKGYGNKAYWVKITTEESGWGTEPSSDLMIEGFPLWILLWGFEDWTNKLQKTQHLWDSYALVVKTKYIKCPEKNLEYYVFTSESFIQGFAPYGNSREEVDPIYINNWYPCWQYQKEAIENLLMCGPAVCKSKNNIHAHMGYTFYFKWGGNPTTMDSIYDPATQPTYPLPNKISQGLEIENPAKDPTKMLYPFDIRRDFITQTAAKRLKKESTTSTSMFTDGVPNQEFSLPIQQTQTEEDPQTSDSEEEEPPLQLQLQQLQLQQQQLLNRYRQLNSLLQSSKLQTLE